MVNAPFIAKDRGIEVKESKSTEVHEYTSTIKVTAKTNKGERSVTGSVFGNGDSRIVQFDEFYFEAVLSKHMLVINNTDVPGVIGKMGNVLGANDINIAGFHLGRVNEGGTTTLRGPRVDRADRVFLRGRARIGTSALPSR